MVTNGLHDDDSGRRFTEYMMNKSSEQALEHFFFLKAMSWVMLPRTSTSILDEESSILVHRSCSFLV